jgi:signal peptidase I
MVYQVVAQRKRRPLKKLQVLGADVRKSKFRGSAWHRLVPGRTIVTSASDAIYFHCMTSKLINNPNTRGMIFIDIIQTVVLALAIFMIAYLFLFQPHQVKGHSMDPNFEDNEYLLTDKMSYRFREPARGDVIVFNAPINRREDYIKRIVGLPNEKISVRGGKVYINGKELPEPYLAPNTYTDPAAFLTEGSEYAIASDEFIVMGDNRGHSSDSRSWGPIKKSDFIGRAWIVYWPPRDTGTIPSQSYTGF